MPLQTRAEIVARADDLFYRQGYERTSFADIAAAVKISRGNFYYHFKTKDEILDAVIDLRAARTRTMLDSWAEGADTPRARIVAFIRMLIDNRTTIMLYGCPVGTLCGELSKLDHAAQKGANKIMAQFADWLTARFVEAGKRKKAPELARHLLARAQGVSALANALHDAKFIRREVAAMEKWLDGELKVQRKK
ncbi:MAG: TetR/AcrR family transcriptional regulator [Alphaproteobacteria bacterium]|nr:TetR/AcrR family transcriptional regulator [Alphaproteobacteria bacterium]